MKAQVGHCGDADRATLECRAGNGTFMSEKDSERVGHFAISALMMALALALFQLASPWRRAISNP